MNCQTCFSVLVHDFDLPASISNQPGCCRELLAELDDPFTRFLEPSRYAALKRGTAGSVTGVGLEVGFDMDVGSGNNLMVSTAE